MRYISITIFCLYSLVGFSQNYGDFPKIKKEQLLRDFDLVYQALDEFHSGMYWYTPKESVRQVYDEIRLQINQDLNVLEFNKLLSQLLFLSREDHTNLSRSEHTLDLILANAVQLPIQIVFLGNRMFCEKNCSDKDLPVEGIEIETINGMKPLVIADSLNRLMPSDGFIKTKFLKRLDGNTFARFYYYWFGIIDTFEVKFANMDTTISLTALTYDQCQENIINRYGNKTKSNKLDDCLEFNANENFAYLGLHSFSNSEISNNTTYSNYDKFLEKSFEEIFQKNIKTLIIDLSQNGGGEEKNVAKLYSYLGDNYKKYKKVRANAYKVVLNNRVDKPITLKSFGFLVRLFGFKKMKDGSYVRKENAGSGDWAYKREVKRKFKGNIYVIIGPDTYSSASILANMLHHNNLATFVGQETGGGYFGNTSGNFVDLVLPNSGLEIEIPAIQYQLNVIDSTLFGRGVIPEFEVIQSYEDYKSGRNSSLDFILNELRY